jgi:hypothetical protein
MLSAAQGVDAEVRPPAVAGTFYPAAKRKLTGTVRELLYEAHPSLPGSLRDQSPRVLIVPHAGYDYSGATAAAAYKLLEGTPRPSRIVLIGPAHRSSLVGRCSVADFTSYQTPLGSVPVDVACRDSLAENELFEKTRYAHASEHSLEVQLPFLQTIWDETPPIVPVLATRLTEADSRRAAAAIAGILDPDALMIVSTDFTHYGRRFRYTPFSGLSEDLLPRRIKELDMEAVQNLEQLDTTGFKDYLSARRPTICGAIGVGIMLEVFSRAESCRPVFLQWANSGQVTETYTNCVSYVAMAFYAPEVDFGRISRAIAEQSAASPNAEPAPRLTQEEQNALLELARDSILSQINGEGPDPEPSVITDTLRGHYGAFVTLRQGEDLRGCVGHVTGGGPLWACVRDCARLAAFRDGRFRPVRAEEVDSLRIEISVLGSLILVRDPARIEVGRDGLVVNRGQHRGVLLPQVAVAQGWDRREFLSQTCRKAGLPPDAWQKPDTTILRFTATVFGER